MSAELRASLCRQIADVIPRGSRWRHYKGVVYTIVAVSLDQTRCADAMDQILVTYCDEDGLAHSRTTTDFLGQWTDEDGYPIERFTLIEDAVSGSAPDLDRLLRIEAAAIKMQLAQARLDAGDSRALVDTCEAEEALYSLLPGAA